jgi:HEPN domain-containing protein
VVSPLDRGEFERWREQARSAAETAVLARRGTRHEWACFLSEQAARLSRHYIPTRYPDAHASGAPSSHYTDADAAQAAEDVRVIDAAVDRAWSELGGQQ